MLKYLKMTNVGPAPTMEFQFGDRLNLLTGDNGLGKSFLLDIAWWALTRKWPNEINANLTGGKMALPSFPGEANISFSFTGKTMTEKYSSSFLWKEQAWTGRPGRPSNPGLVVYAMADGSFAVWDPSRNYWRTQDNVDVQDRPPAYVFNSFEIWDGLDADNGKPVCNGLIRDWVGWQKENGETYQHLCSVLHSLSPSDSEIIIPGKLRRISLDDARDIPTLKMPYGQDVPVLHASSGMRRIITMAYILVWAWEEHCKASELVNEAVTDQIIFIVDEIESHLHPKWQFNIIHSILTVMQTLSHSAQIQLICATHSPLVLASIESYFDLQKDKWFDFDLADSTVMLTPRDFEKHGDVSNWLTSEAFDLTSSRNPEYAKLIEDASQLFETPAISIKEIQEMYARLLDALNPKDDFLFRWRAICEKKGFLQ